MDRDEIIYEVLTRLSEKKASRTKCERVVERILSATEDELKLISSILSSDDTNDINKKLQSLKQRKVQRLSSGMERVVDRVRLAIYQESIEPVDSLTKLLIEVFDED